MYGPEHFPVLFSRARLDVMIYATTILLAVKTGIYIQSASEPLGSRWGLANSGLHTLQDPSIKACRLA